MYKLKITLWTVILINIISLYNYNVFSNVITSNIEQSILNNSEKLELVKKLLKKPLKAFMLF